MPGPAPVSTAGIRYVPMSYDDYRRLPEKPKAEWVDGVAVIHVAPPSWPHSSLQLGVGVWLRIHLPGALVGTEVEVRLPNNRIRVPDVAVIEHPPAGRAVDGTVEPPLLVVEILSPSTRSEDLLRKSGEYASAGIQQFWVVDPDDEQSIEVNQLTDGAWQQVARVTAEQPTAEVSVPGHDPVELDFRHIFSD